MTKYSRVGLLLTVFALIGCNRQVNVELLTGATLGDTSKINLALKQGANLNVHAFDDGATPLIVAAREGHLEAVKQLFKAGADLNLAGAGGTPLYWACFRQHKSTIDYLHSVGAKLNADAESIEYMKKQGKFPPPNGCV